MNAEFTPTRKVRTKSATDDTATTIKEPSVGKTLKEDSQANKIKEEENVFAQGLPEWDVVPPQMLVRRKKR